MAEEEKKRHKPGVRTKLNSGDKKVQTNTDKNSKQAKAAQPNPTAVSASKKLPSMQLSKEANWAEETSNSVLSAVNPVSSERSLGENKVVPVPQEKSLPAETKKKEAKPVAAPEPEKKNKYKKKKEKKSSIIDDIKTSIAQGFDSVKIDYDQLAQIQNELHVKRDNIKSSLTDGVSKLKDYANSAVENAAAAAEEMKKKQKELAAAADQRMKAEVERIEREKKQKQEEVKANAKPASDVSAEELQAAADAAKQNASEIDKEKLQKLNQATQRRDGAKNALNALNTQLQYASPEQRKGLQERIRQKEKQLEEAEALIAELSQ